LVPSPFLSVPQNLNFVTKRFPPHRNTHKKSHHDVAPSPWQDSRCFRTSIPGAIDPPGPGADGLEDVDANKIVEHALPIQGLPESVRSPVRFAIFLLGLRGWRCNNGPGRGAETLGVVTRRREATDGACDAATRPREHSPESADPSKRRQYRATNSERQEHLKLGH
jgi:hypothetical protein